jgi:hypothetical protein
MISSTSSLTGESIMCSNCSGDYENDETPDDQDLQEMGVEAVGNLRYLLNHPDELLPEPPELFSDDDEEKIA